MQGKSVAAFMCLAQIFALATHSSYAALVPVFIGDWGLSNAEAGWIQGAQALGYLVGVPFLGAATDRIDARRIYMLSSLVGIGAALGFAGTAEGFWSALGWRFVTGLGDAGLYMPGLRAINDRVTGGERSRVIVAYTATYSFGVAASFLLAGFVAEGFGWRATFFVTALGPALAGAIAFVALKPKPPAVVGERRPVWLQFRAVFSHRPVMGYVLAYAWHSYELNAYRAWLVAYMTFVGVQAAASGQSVLAPTLVAAAATLCGLPASIFGNELALRIGRRRLIARVMAMGIGVAAVIGCFGTVLPYWVVVPLIMLYALVIAADSGSLTAGTVAASRPEVQGATLALQSAIATTHSFFGPLLCGLALDLGGGREQPLAWGLCFAVIGMGGAMGLAMLHLMRPKGEGAAG